MIVYQLYQKWTCANGQDTDLIIAHSKEVGFDIFKAEVMDMKKKNPDAKLTCVRVEWEEIDIESWEDISIRMV